MQYIKQEISYNYFSDQRNVTGESYKRHLKYDAFRKLQNYSEDTIFQQDDAPPQYAIPLSLYLDLISARSPDLTAWN